MTVTIETRFNANCGCGVEYRQGETPVGMALPLTTADQVVKAAQAHASMMGHTMHMNGEIKAIKAKPQVIADGPRYRAPRQQWVPRKDMPFSEVQ